MFIFNSNTNEQGSELVNIMLPYLMNHLRLKSAFVIYFGYLESCVDQQYHNIISYKFGEMIESLALKISCLTEFGKDILCPFMTQIPNKCVRTSGSSSRSIYRKKWVFQFSLKNKQKNMNRILHWKINLIITLPAHNSSILKWDA